MCIYWNVPLSVYWRRIRRGWKKQEALTGVEMFKPLAGPAKAVSFGIPCQDHTGRWFSSKKDRCEHWGVNVNTFDYRIKVGHTLEEALTGNFEAAGVNGMKSRKVTDHEGTEFPSKAAMCRHWNVPIPTFKKRIKNGYTLEEALTGRRQKKK